VNEVPRRQSRRGVSPSDVVAEVEEDVEVVFAGVFEDGVEPVHEIEAAADGARRSRRTSYRP
jgi:hypothetical protein